MNNTELKIPRMMTVRQVAKTGVLPENAIRVLLKQGHIPAVYSGNTAYINYENFVEYLVNLKAPNVNKLERR